MPSCVISAYTGPVTPPRLHFLGHSTVRAELAGKTVLTDPLLTVRLGPLRRVVTPLAASAWAGVDLVLISHLHNDHLHLRSLRLLGVQEAAMDQLLPLSKDLMKASYPELETDWSRISQVAYGEEREIEGTTFVYGTVDPDAAEKIYAFTDVDNRPRFLEELGMTQSPIVSEASTGSPDEFAVTWSPERADELESDIFVTYVASEDVREAIESRQDAALFGEMLAEEAVMRRELIDKIARLA